MAKDHTKPDGPDLVHGIALSDLPDGGKLVGHSGDEQVLLVRRGTEVFAIGATCTHPIMVDLRRRRPEHSAGCDGLHGRPRPCPEDRGRRRGFHLVMVSHPMRWPR